jgi:hypothetical protein
MHTPLTATITTPLELVRNHCMPPLNCYTCLLYIRSDWGMSPPSGM